jgi:hypothetical protein
MELTAITIYGWVTSPLKQSISPADVPQCGSCGRFPPGTMPHNYSTYRWSGTRHTCLAIRWPGGRLHAHAHGPDDQFGAHCHGRRPPGNGANNGGSSRRGGDQAQSLRVKRSPALVCWHSAHRN